jgi:hypothetical protein
MHATSGHSPRLVLPLVNTGVSALGFPRTVARLMQPHMQRPYLFASELTKDWNEWSPPPAQPPLQCQCTTRAA